MPQTRAFSFSFLRGGRGKTFKTNGPQKTGLCDMTGPLCTNWIIKQGNVKKRYQTGSSVFNFYISLYVPTEYHNQMHRRHYWTEFPRRGYYVMTILTSSKVCSLCKLQGAKGRPAALVASCGTICFNTFLEASYFFVLCFRERTMLDSAKN